MLSDFDLIEKATNDKKWAKLGDHEPSGTNGMKGNIKYKIAVYLYSKCDIYIGVGIGRATGARAPLVCSVVWYKSQVKPNSILQQLSNKHKC